MYDYNLDIKTIRESISSQENSLSEITGQIASLETKKILIEKTIETYKQLLPDDKHIIENIIHSENQLTKENTYNIIVDLNDRDSIQVKDIIEAYKNLGCHTHGRHIFRHLDELIKEGKAIQLNPEAKRHRKYKAIVEN